MAAGLMIGNELTVARFLHPTLARLGDNVHSEAAIAYARLFDTVMPPWYAVVAALTLVEVWRRWPLPLVGDKLSLALILWTLAIIYTLVFPAPLNRHIAA